MPLDGNQPTMSAESPPGLGEGSSAPATAPGGAMPRGLKLGLTAALVIALSGAIYLFAVRGQALLIDLYAASAAFLCL